MALDASRPQDAGRGEGVRHGVLSLQLGEEARAGVIADRHLQQQDLAVLASGPHDLPLPARDERLDDAKSGQTGALLGSTFRHGGALIVP
ncbi:hypothetical protein SAMN02745121_06988 [Nannocystis exedens]|uniref:Uncharacterized protein n=1 Tax=Nannocystis exedens TaxID=54 RepID=A0A1I2G080_9BACT|nr:hypothetical protein SAMN02745121_06988 [Nannocystis exedens]